MSVHTSNEHSELSPDEEEVLDEEQQLRQLTERLRKQFKEALSEPLPANLIELVDQLKEDNSEEQ